jgi:hypothetical protein
MHSLVLLMLKNGNINKLVIMNVLFGRKEGRKEERSNDVEA